jgi:hypothetical protein
MRTHPSKRAKSSQQPAEISFDRASRHEYLTGFHKRKLLRVKKARELAEERDREMARRERGRVRDYYYCYYSFKDKKRNSICWLFGFTVRQG